MTPPGPGLGRTAIWTLLFGNALSAIGVGFFLPIFPLFVASRGGSAATVGYLFGIGVAGRLLSQYPAGRVSDRVGRRPVLIAGMVGYGLLFPAYLLPLPLEALYLIRLLHAFTGGVFGPVALAVVADLVEPARRAEAYGRLRAADMTGFLVGPLLGGMLAVFSLSWVFVCGAVLSLAAAALLTRLPGTRPAPWPGAEGPAFEALTTLRRLAPVIALAVPIFYTVGTYDTVWSLYMTSRGANPFQVGLSFAVYALPIIVLGGLGGRVADRIGHFRAGTAAALGYAWFMAVYPVVRSIPALIGLGVLEGALTAAGQPALTSEVSRIAGEGAQGRTQGVYATALSGAEIAGALVAGQLYQVRPAAAFLAGAGVCLAGALLAPLFRRRAGSGAGPVAGG